MFLMVPSIFALLTRSAAAEEEPFKRGHQLGLSAGTPAGLNVEYAYEFGRRAVYVSGGFYGTDFYGVQAGVTLERSGSQRKALSLNLVGGHFSVEDDTDNSQQDTWSYGGVEVHLRYRRIFLAPVISFGDGSVNNSGWRNDNNPVLLARLGFTWPL